MNESSGFIGGDEFKHQTVGFVQRLIGDMSFLTGDPDLARSYGWIKERKEVLSRYYPDQDVDSLTMAELFDKKYV